MDYTIKDHDDFFEIHLSGNLLHALNNDPFFEAVEASMDKYGPNKALLNLSDVDYINSTGIALVVRLHTKFANKKGKMVICSPSETVNRLFEVTKLSGVLHIHENREAAVTQL